jgi:hypothetical protein
VQTNTNKEKYDEVTKERVKELLKSKMPTRQVAKLTGVRRSTVSDWKIKWQEKNEL